MSIVQATPAKQITGIRGNENLLDLLDNASYNSTKVFRPIMLDISDLLTMDAKTRMGEASRRLLEGASVAAEQYE